MRTRLTFTRILVGILILITPLGLFAQKPAGESVNLCPNVTYRYTSSGFDVNGGSCGSLSWICSGCLNSDGLPGSSVLASGVNANGSLWADVKWAL